MSNGTRKPRRAMQLVGAFIAVVGLVASITAYASAQTAQSRYYSGVITGPDFCINNSLGGPRTYPFDRDRDGVADICSLPTTRRATVARQNAMELLALDFVARFGQLYAYECTGVLETYGEPANENTDECAAPRLADAAGQPTPPVPASRVSPVLTTWWPSGFFSGPVITSSTFCLNRSLGGPVTYPLDLNGDNVADICSLPTTRRATIARQNALEQLAAERSSFFDALFSSECARLINVSFGESQEAFDECADRETGTGRPLPGDDDEDDGGTGGGDSSGGSTGGTSGGNTENPNRGTGPTQSISAPKATIPRPYSNRAAQNVQLAPGHRQITVSWEPVPVEDDGENPVVDTDIYDSGEVFEYVVAYSTSTSMSNSQQLVVNPSTGAIINQRTGSGWSCTSGTNCTITQLTNFTTYYVWVLANRGKSNSTGSGTSANLDYWTPTLSITPGLAGPPTWVDQDATEDGVQGLVAGDYGEMRAFWQAPVGDTPNSYTLQWGTSQSFANNCNTSNNCEQKTVTSPPGAGELIEGLSNNRTYYVRVQGSTSNGPGTWSLVQSLRLASNDPNPGKPTDVSLTSSGGGTTLAVSWTAPVENLPDDPAATSYRVQWRNVSDNENWDATRRQESPTASPQNITGLDALDRYQVRVLAVTGKVAGPWSDIKEITLGRPGAPMINSINPGSRDLEVAWSAPDSSPSPTGIVIQWDTSSGFATNCVADASCNEMALSWSATGTTPLTGLNSNTVYYVRMRSTNSNGFSSWSETRSGEPGTIDAPTSVSPAAIGSPATNDDYRKLHVTWSSGSETDKPDLTGFGIRYKRTGTTNWERTHTLNDFTVRDDTTYNCNSADIDGVVTGNSFGCTLTGLLSATSYDVQVRATNSYGSGPWSDTVTGSPADGKLISSSISTVEDVASQSGSLRVTWTQADESPKPAATRFQIEWCYTPTNGSDICRTSGDLSVSADQNGDYGYTISGLTNDTQYNVRVRARNTHGYSEWSSSVSATPTNTN